jgi:hypothetical protein
MGLSTRAGVTRISLVLVCIGAATGCPPGVPVADVCDRPNSERVESLELGRASLDSVFEAWEEGDEIEVVYGPQGDAMVALRYRVRGSNLACISQHTILRHQEEEPMAEDVTALRVYREAEDVYLTETHWVVIRYDAAPATGTLFELEAEVGSAVASVQLRAVAR